MPTDWTSYWAHEDMSSACLSTPPCTFVRDVALARVALEIIDEELEFVHARTLQTIFHTKTITMTTMINLNLLQSLVTRPCILGPEAFNGFRCLPCSSCSRRGPRHQTKIKMKLLLVNHGSLDNRHWNAISQCSVRLTSGRA